MIPGKPLSVGVNSAYSIVPVSSSRLALLQTRPWLVGWERGWQLALRLERPA